MDQGGHTELPRTGKSFTHAIRIQVTQTASGVRAPGSVLAVLAWKDGGWGGMVGVVSSVGVGLLGHADPQSLVHNIHGTARLGSQQRSYSIGTCHTLIRGPIQQLRNPEPTRH